MRAARVRRNWEALPLVSSGQGSRRHCLGSPSEQFSQVRRWSPAGTAAPRVLALNRCKFSELGSPAARTVAPPKGGAQTLARWSHAGRILPIAPAKTEPNLALATTSWVARSVAAVSSSGTAILRALCAEVKPAQ